MSNTIKLIKKEVIANDTMLFHWEKPEGVEFKAGQFGEFNLIEPSETDEKGNSRDFSFVFAPAENKLAIATRIRDSAYKKVLKDLPERAEVEFNGPYGDFSLHKTESTPAVFIIGGIGITPVRSMIAQATINNSAHDMTLLYSNKTPDDAPFLNDLEAFAEENDNFTFVPVMTRADSKWNGESGHIDADMLKKYISDVKMPIYYLSGPGGMVWDMREMLLETGVKDDNIITEEFPGY
ncbi:FAD-dependent oxidoreductase [Virgibacillus sp. JSM 102003]|uniref:FAD-dependent oxidoreductase n=1 Tax=Virgibacillus sp. JSM 102003 TaxID=1562108 RepID=UPI0035C11AF4